MTLFALRIKKNSEVSPHTNRNLPVGTGSGNSKLPSFTKGIQLGSAETNKVDHAEAEAVGTYDYSARSMRTKGRGVMFAHPVDWMTSKGYTFDGSVLIFERLVICDLFATKEMQEAEENFCT